ncbi:MAG TPA: regulatory signaling modulator protein AmpE [Burkholderiaceae bacterium]|nr:regulatory signaling modulator protein AmpE [Burkholderiaceae bacterium]
MGFVALIVALLLDHLRPLSRDNAFDRTASALADAASTHARLPQRAQAVGAWLLVTVGAVAAVALAQWLLWQLHPLLVFALHVAVLYATLGLRRANDAINEIQVALAANDPEGARAALQRWVRHDAPDTVVLGTTRADVCQATIVQALIGVHRNFFGPLFWYLVLPGAIGPVLYRSAQLLAARSHRLGAADAEFAATAYRWLDWLPLRVAAAGFAVVGNFEDAMVGWRSATESRSVDPQRAILIGAGGGALGLRLADPFAAAAPVADGAVVVASPSANGDYESSADAPVGLPPHELSSEPQPRSAAGPAVGRNSGTEAVADGAGFEPDAAAVASAAGLVWRSIVLWIVLFGMLTAASY